jgi:hypothetical protein
MPHDRNGTILQKGDVVLIQGTVTHIHPTEDYCNVSLKAENPQVPAGQEYSASLSWRGNSRLLTLLRRAGGRLLFLALGAMIGCSSAPAQKPTQTVAPETATTAKLDKVSADILSLKQQNDLTLNAIQKSAQDADQFRNEVKGGIGSLTQMQFRLESWLAQASNARGVRDAGVAPYPAPGAVRQDRLVGKRGDLPGDSGVNGGRASAGADAEKPVLKGGPTVLHLLTAFVLGALVPCVGLLLLLRRHLAAITQYETRISALENQLFGKKASAPTSPTTAGR